MNKVVCSACGDEVVPIKKKRLVFSNYGWSDMVYTTEYVCSNSKCGERIEASELDAAKGL